jgi:hypothetical protein
MARYYSHFFSEYNKPYHQLSNSQIFSQTTSCQGIVNYNIIYLILISNEIGPTSGRSRCNYTHIQKLVTVFTAGK